VEVLLSDVECEGGESGKRVRVERVKKMGLNHGMLDIAFAGNPNQCDPETCKGLEELFDWRRTMSAREAGKYKYVLDVLVFILTLCSYGRFINLIVATATYLFVYQVDGNGCSSQFKRLMTANAPTFKSTIYPEWYVISPTSFIPSQTKTPPIPTGSQTASPPGSTMSPSKMPTQT